MDQTPNLFEYVVILLMSNGTELGHDLLPRMKIILIAYDRTGINEVN